MDYTVLTQNSYYKRVKSSIAAKRSPKQPVPFGYRGVGLFGTFLIILVLGGTWISRLTVVGILVAIWATLRFLRLRELAMRRTAIHEFSTANGLQYQTNDERTAGGVLGTALRTNTLLIPYDTETVTYSDELSGQIAGRNFSYLFCNVKKEVVSREQRHRSSFVALYVDMGRSLPTVFLATKQRNTLFGSQGINPRMGKCDAVGMPVPEAYKLYTSDAIMPTEMSTVLTPRVAELLATDGTCDVLFQGSSLVLFIPVALPLHYVAALPQMFTLAEQLVGEMLREDAK